MQYIDEFIREVNDERPLQSRSIDRAVKEMDIEKKEALNRYFEIQISFGESIKDIVSDYYFMIDETNKYQTYFFRNNGNYMNTTYAEIADIAYDNEMYMHKYMIGLAVSTFIWPQHTELFNFFCDYIKSVQGVKKRAYLEIGAGHGLYALRVVESGKYDRCYFVDISEESLELTKRMLAKAGNSSHTVFECADFFSYKADQRFDFISASEVIEAVENPLDFLKKCRELIKYDGRVHISTPINSPMVDCIYLFKNKEQVEDMVYRAGFKIDSKLYVPYKSYSMEICEKKRFPVNVAYILKPM